MLVLTRSQIRELVPMADAIESASGFRCPVT